jgi:hypothetical protein
MCEKGEVWKLSRGEIRVAIYPGVEGEYNLFNERVASDVQSCLQPVDTLLFFDVPRRDQYRTLDYRSRSLTLSLNITVIDANQDALGHHAF